MHSWLAKVSTGVAISVITAIIYAGWAPFLKHLFFPSYSLAIPNVVVYAMILLSTFYIVSVLIEHQTKSSLKKYPFLEYTEDKLEGVICRWVLVISNSEPVVSKLRWYCPECDTQLICNVREITGMEYARKKRQSIVDAEQPGVFTKLMCEHCHQIRLPEYSGSVDQLNRKIIDQIERKLRSGEWKKVVSQRKSEVIS